MNWSTSATRSSGHAILDAAAEDGKPRPSRIDTPVTRRGAARGRPVRREPPVPDWGCPAGGWAWPAAAPRFRAARSAAPPWPGSSVGRTSVGGGVVCAASQPADRSNATEPDWSSAPCARSSRPPWRRHCTSIEGQRQGGLAPRTGVGERDRGRAEREPATGWPSCTAAEENVITPPTRRSSGLTRPHRSSGRLAAAVPAAPPAAATTERDTDEAPTRPSSARHCRALSPLRSAAHVPPFLFRSSPPGSAPAETRSMPRTAPRPAGWQGCC